MTNAACDGFYQFIIGERVEKRAGHKQRGIVVSRFKNLAGKARYVIECPNTTDALDVYSEGQLISQIMRAK